MDIDGFARMFDCSVSEILRRLRTDGNDFWRWWWTQCASEPMGMHHASLPRTPCHFGKMLSGLDVGGFLQEIDAHPENWRLDTKRNAIGVQRHTDAIMLRSAVYTSVAGRDNVDIMMDIQESKLAAAAEQYPRLMRFLGEFAGQHGKGTLARAMIVRLLPRMEVGRHRDSGYYYLCRDRYHLVLQSAGSRMECGGVHCTWNVGEVWWFNNNLWHSAGNEGDDWRIHVIFDVLPRRNQALVEEFKRHTEYYRAKLPGPA
jgi:aspartyl/asparaginyl beta-hydroxylase